MTLQEIRDLAKKAQPRAAGERRILLALHTTIGIIDLARVPVRYVAEGKSNLKNVAQEWLDAYPSARAADPQVRAVEDDIQWAKTITAKHHKEEKHAGQWMACTNAMCIKGRKMVEVGETKKMHLEGNAIETTTPRR